eukprot:349194_1
MPIINDTDTEQTTIFAFDETVSNESTFEYSSGFEITTGTKISAGIPLVVKDETTIEITDSNEWTWGETNTTEQNWSSQFQVVCTPRASIDAQAIVSKSPMDIPFVMTLQNGFGNIQQTNGIWH